MSLTTEQEEWKNRLVCERLCSDEANDGLRLSFQNSRVNSLEEYITSTSSSDEDSANRTAVYVVKIDNSIVAYFSLRCGLTYDSIVSKTLLEIYTLHKKGDKATHEDKEKIQEYISINSLSDKEYNQLMTDVELKLQAVEPKKNDERRFDEYEHSQLATKTYGAIQLVHFCKHEDASITGYIPFEHIRFGELVFWFKIYAKIIQMSEMLGFEHLSLCCYIKGS